MNATHIFCRTCHGWWPRPDGCPHHGAPGEGWFTDAMRIDGLSRDLAAALARVEAAEALAAQRLDYIDGLHESWVAAEAKVTALEAALDRIGDLAPAAIEEVRAARDRQEP